MVTMATIKVDEKVFKRIGEEIDERFAILPLIAVNLPLWMRRKLLCVHQNVRDPKAVLLAKVSDIFDIWAGINVRRYLGTCD